MMSNVTLESWGRYPASAPDGVMPVTWRADQPAWNAADTSVLPYGMGRSYGDVCLNNGGTLLLTRGLDRFIDFDPVTGIIRAEAGVIIEELLRFVMPHGWFIPVTPGTKYVTLGGAVANDVHGKNHHRMGTIGRHVRCFELVRSDGRRLLCSSESHADWYAATIGGMGLTGLVTWVELQLIRIESPIVDMETIKVRTLDEIVYWTMISDKDWDYTVSWIDCTKGGAQTGRGLFMRGNHARSAGGMRVDRRTVDGSLVDIPVDAPNWLLNRYSVTVFNRLYFNRQLRRFKRSRVGIDPFFYPLDIVHGWNRLYGKRGMLQYQCVIPYNGDTQLMRSILSEFRKAGIASFLAVLKMFGDIESPGVLSFPKPGLTLALDFGNDGTSVHRVLDRLDDMVLEAGGRVYAAKDARMSAATFRRMYPEAERLVPFIDPKFSSSFWRRVWQEAR